MKLDYDPDPGDLRRLVDGLKLAGRIYLAAGAKRVMPSTFRYLPCTSPRPSSTELDHDDPRQHRHPAAQLPTRRAATRSAATRRRASSTRDFRVHGTRGRLSSATRACSRRAITVNPQLTVMALAELAAARVE